MPINFFETGNIALGHYWVATCDGIVPPSSHFVEVYVLSEKQQKYRATRINIHMPTPEVPPDIAALVNMPDEGRRWAEMAIEGDLFGWYQRQGPGATLPAPLALVPTPSNVLAQCWLRGMFKEEIPRIASATRDNGLEEMLRKVTRLPKIGFQSLSD
jgi:hypothetical protein